jgi:adenylate cyclase
LYADIRGSTTIAETTSSVDFTRMLNQFYKVVTDAVDSEMSAIDHMAGDGIMVMWVPAFVDEHHSKHAIAAGRRILREFPDMATLPVGVGVHTGEAYVGVVGEAGARNFTVLGDTPNTVARLSSAAGAGELVMSEAAATAAGVETTSLEHLTLDLKGKAEPFPAWIEKVADIKVRE